MSVIGEPEGGGCFYREGKHSFCGKCPAYNDKEPHPIILKRARDLGLDISEMGREEYKKKRCHNNKASKECELGKIMDGLNHELYLSRRFGEIQAESMNRD